MSRNRSMLEDFCPKVNPLGPFGQYSETKRNTLGPFHKHKVLLLGTNIHHIRLFIHNWKSGSPLGPDFLLDFVFCVFGTQAV